MVDKGFLKQENREVVVVGETIEGLLEKMKNDKPLLTPEWFNKDRLLSKGYYIYNNSFVN